MNSGLTGSLSVKDAEITGAGVTFSKFGATAFANIKGSGFRGLLSCNNPKGIDGFTGFVSDLYHAPDATAGCPVRVKFDAAGDAIAIGHITRDDLWFHFSDVEGTSYVAAD
jgi:hypothetical protein